MTTDPKPDESRCPACGGRNLAISIGDYPTGVVAPDGGQETRRQTYIYCHDCGALEER